MATSVPCLLSSNGRRVSRSRLSVADGQLSGCLPPGDSSFFKTFHDCLKSLGEPVPFGHRGPSDSLTLLPCPLHPCLHQLPMDALLCVVPIPVPIPAQGGARLPGCWTLIRDRGRHVGVRKTRVCPRTEFSGERRCFLGSEEISTIAYEETTIQTLLYLDMGPGVAGLVGPGVQLKVRPWYRTVLSFATRRISLTQSTPSMSSPSGTSR
jgi:hypothetical protein